MKYINRENAYVILKKHKRNRLKHKEKLQINDEEQIVKFIYDLPTEDVTPVKHAHWIVDKESDENTCSHCGGIVDFGDAKTYCQYCGAKMDEKIDK